MSEETEKPSGFECPRCGAIVEYFIDKYFGNVQCPSCGEVFKNSELPEGAVVRRIKKEKKHRAEERRETPFRRPKTSKELVEEICDKYQVKERAKRIIADWCDRVPGGVLHPAHFEKLLLDLDSGVSKKEATLIAEEYEFALQKAQAEARELGVSRPFYYTPSYDVSTYTGRVIPPYQPEYPAPTYTARDIYGRPVTTPPGYRAAFGQPAYPMYPPQPVLSRQEIERIFEEKASKLLEEKRRRDELETLKQQVANVPKIVEETVTKVVPQTPPNVVTTEQLKDVLEKETVKTQLEVQSKQIEMWKDLYNKALDEVRKTREEWAKDREEFLKKVEESKKPVQISTQGYQRDEVRLLADAVQVLGQKTPVKDLGSILIRFFPREQQAVQAPKEKVGESKITEMLPKELVEEE